MKYSVLDAFNARTDLVSKYGDNALLLFALQLRFRIDDIDVVASNALTDYPDDKKCDLVYVDREKATAVIAQGYFAQKPKQQANANKAMDLNTASSWLLTRPVEDISVEILRQAATDLRDAISQGEIDNINIWYVHNLSESESIKNELMTVENTFNSNLKSYFPERNDISVQAVEVGLNTLQDWYKGLTTPILVTDKFEVTVPGGFEIEHGKYWKSFVTAVPAGWLHKLYNQHRSELFSANIRGYLGSRDSQQNINNAIKQSAEKTPDDFWVYNNGVTAIVNSFKFDKTKLTLHIQGLSIVNGAQTTGAIGSLETEISENAFVPARFVVCQTVEIIQNIIKFNNTQNPILAPDFRSNDPVQTRLRREFDQIPNATYLGGRRENEDDVIRRNTDLLPSYTVAQALAAFHQKPVLAYNSKSQIWLNNSTYSDYFNEHTTAVHIVFVYSLLKAIDEYKVKLRQLGQKNLTQSQQRQLKTLNSRGADFLVTAAIGACLEIFADRPISNAVRVSFGKIAPDDAIKLWSPIVETTAALFHYLEDAIDPGGVKNTDRAEEQIRAFSSLVEATKASNSEVHKNFAKNLQIS